MVSGRLIVAVRQLLLITFMFGCSVLLISSQQRAVYDRTSDSLKRLRDLQIDNEKLQGKARELVSESNRTRELVNAHLKQMDTIEQFTKKKNLVLRGLKEEKEDEDLEKIVLKLIEDKFKIALNPDDLETVERIPGEKPSISGNPYTYKYPLCCVPVKIRFVRFKDKAKIFYKRKSFPKYLSLEEDITASQKEHRKKSDFNIKNAPKVMGKVVKRSGGKLLAK